jgi:hypothetical protein
VNWYTMPYVISRTQLEGLGSLLFSESGIQIPPSTTPLRLDVHRCSYTGRVTISSTDPLTDAELAWVTGFVAGFSAGCHFDA